MQYACPVPTYYIPTYLKAEIEGTVVSRYAVTQQTVCGKAHRHVTAVPSLSGLPSASTHYVVVVAHELVWQHINRTIATLFLQSRTFLGPTRT